MVTGISMTLEMVGRFKVHFDTEARGLVDGSEMRGKRQGQKRFR